MVDRTLLSPRQNIEYFIEILCKLLNQLYDAGSYIWCYPYAVIGGSLVARVVVCA